MRSDRVPTEMILCRRRIVDDAQRTNLLGSGFPGVVMMPGRPISNGDEDPTQAIKLRVTLRLLVLVHPEHNFVPRAFRDSYMHHLLRGVSICSVGMRFTVCRKQLGVGFASF